MLGNVPHLALVHVYTCPLGFEVSLVGEISLELRPGTRRGGRGCEKNQLVIGALQKLATVNCLVTGRLLPCGVCRPSFSHDWVESVRGSQFEVRRSRIDPRRSAGTSLELGVAV